ncbi:MAG: AI-2E family transporter, partial [Actinomycetia bacterium]|nr:AI-2E family transporter [Actinomycetes bacterium]
MDTDGGAAQESQEHADQLSTVHVVIDSKVIWKVIFAILATMAGLWAIGQAQSLVVLVGMSFFFSLALQPAVLWLTNRYEWRRGSAVGVIYLGALVGSVAMILILIPAVAQLASTIGASGAEWVTGGLEWVQDTFGITIGNGDNSYADEWAAFVDKNLQTWAADFAGSALGLVSTGVSLIFNLATMAMFTFYFTADAPRFQRTVLGLLPHDRQAQVGWAWDQAIIQTGGYFYSRMILMFINGFGFFFTMVLVGMPVSLAIPLAVFGGFVSVFIPAIGTYIGGAIPIALTLAIQGVVPALIVLGYVLIYQQVENYWLSPKISAKTMTLNGAVAFGGALFGGA